MWLVVLIVRRYIGFLIIITYPYIYTPLVSALFATASLLFVHFFRRRRKKKNDKSRFFLTARCLRKLRYYSDAIYSFDWKSAIEYGGGV